MTKGLSKVVANVYEVAPDYFKSIEKSEVDWYNKDYRFYNSKLYRSIKEQVNEHYKELNDSVESVSFIYQFIDLDTKSIYQITKDDIKLDSRKRFQLSDDYAARLIEYCSSDSFIENHIEVHNIASAKSVARKYYTQNTNRYLLNKLNQDGSYLLTEYTIDEIMIDMKEIFNDTMQVYMDEYAKINGL